MKAAKACAALGYVYLLSCFGNFKLRTASSSRRTCRLRPYGLSTFGIRDTGQNTSQVRDALRSLHYVAVVTCRPPLIPAVTSISTTHFGVRPHAAWGQAPRSMLKTLRYPNIPSSYRFNYKNKNSMRNILGLILLRSKKVRFSREKRGSAPGRTRRTYASCGVSET